MYAKVIVDIKHEDVNHSFDYIVPEQFGAFLERGMRVLVPFGNQNRLGYVIEIMKESLDATKMILEVLDAYPTIDEELFILIQNILKYSPSLYSEVFAAVIPSELLVSYHKVVKIIDSKKCPHEFLPFFNTKGIWNLTQQDQIYYPKLKRLKDQKVISVETIIKEKGSEKTETIYTLNLDHHYNRIEAYQNVLDFFLDNEEVSRKELLDVGISTSTITTLIKHQVLIPAEKAVFREIKHHFDLEDKKVILTDEQDYAKNEIVKSIGKRHTFLLKGITGSGKTEVYIEAMEHVLLKNKKVLILVPEITLIAPMAKRLKSRFKDVAIYHSALSKGERYDQYKKIQSNQASIVLGTRSAIFLPIDHLGLIIIDEEHDQSYEQLEGVIYDAREIALQRSIYHHAPLVLGSATPSVNTMYKATQDEYTLLELTRRPFDAILPIIWLVDMKDELKKKNSSIFSKSLLEGMKKRIENKEQTILLFNRKGYSPFVLCRSCGDVPTCPHCDISLTYYKDRQLLKCHYCGYEKPYQATCEVCSEPKVKEFGAGIEYVEAELKKALPKARVLRMDHNVTRTKGSHEIIWNKFNNEEADILLGTQMIAKGLDFPKVTLVGVLMADLLLKVPSYRASENCYMLLAQVTGRSGRFLPGEAIIQGYNLDHYAIKSVSEGYDNFYREALYNRKLSSYLPFKNTSQILVSGMNFLKTYQHAFMLKKMLSGQSIDVLGPTQAIIKKIKDHYRFTLTIKYEDINYKKLFELIKSFDQDPYQVRYYPTLDIV
ncbi:MAG: primosomal protein N' [Tenericutes bacterium HGW-Tenericutes-2]|jgi:primosomal protein N' (replication factor Y)|nr:MAG: primosomal protein N' [Tenericutes bacterium HGW-Tenericutes-2]